ncbi:Uncharacterised protein at_DN2190, partial [Pycnogonum litorale]
MSETGSSRQTTDDGSEPDENRAMLETFQMADKKKRSKKELFLRSTSSASFFRGLKRMGSFSSTGSSDDDVESGIKSNVDDSSTGRSKSAETRRRRKNLVKQSTFCEGVSSSRKENNGIVVSTKELTSLLNNPKSDSQRRKCWSASRSTSIDIPDASIDRDDRSNAMTSSPRCVKQTLTEDLKEEEEEDDDDDEPIAVGAADSEVKWDEDNGMIDAQDIGGAIENFLQKLTVKNIDCKV